MRSTAHIQFVRDTSGLNSERWLEIWSGGVRRRVCHGKFHGTPYELSRVLFLVRHTLRSTPTSKLTAHLRAISDSFLCWKAINASRVAAHRADCAMFEAAREL